MRSAGALSVLLLSVVVAAEAAWSAKTYPNPVVDVTKCGRQGVSSWVCDPDGLISYSSANTIESILKEIAVAKAPFAEANCQPGAASPVRGYQVAVALMEKMVVHDGEAPEAAAAAFARRLYDAWGVGDPRCQNGALLLLARADRQVYIFAGAGARGLLDAERIQDVVGNMREDLRAGKTGAALVGAAADVGLVLAGGAVEKPDKGGGWLGPGVLVSAFAAFNFFLCWQSRRKGARRERCAALLAKLRGEQARALAEQRFPESSCPVCMEDFAAPGPRDGGKLDGDGAAPSAPPLPSEAGAGGSGAPDDRPSAPLLAPPRGKGKEGAAAVARPDTSGVGKPMVLPCGHAFCEACLSRWLDDHNSCPICRSDLGVGPPAAAPGSQAAWNREAYEAEVLFRIGSMQRMYPYIMTADVVAAMTRQVHEGTVVDWPAVRAEQVNDAALRHERSMAGAHGASGGFGGGSSLGGGGGGGSW